MTTRIQRKRAWDSELVRQLLPWVRIRSPWKDAVWTVACGTAHPVGRFAAMRDGTLYTADVRWQEVADWLNEAGHKFDPSEVRRVLADDGTVWLNLGSCYASGGTPANQSPLLWRGPACGSGDTESRYSPGGDRVCPDCGGERQDGTPSRRARIFRNAQQREPDSPPSSWKGRDSGLGGYGSRLPGVSPPVSQESTKQLSSSRPRAVSDLSAKASGPRKSPETSSLDAFPSVDRLACTCGTSPIQPPLVVRTVGRESFFSACRRSDCKGIGQCGLCWCSLAIPSLGVKQKDDIGIPHLVSMALQADGWWLRSEIIWHKPNPMPESVRDRPTRAHEQIFLLSKSARYHYDADAIREPAITEGDTRHLRTDSYKAPGGPREDNGSRLRTGNPTHGRNKRSVWTVATQPYSGAHFATFPPKLVEPCILAGSQPGDVVLDPFSGSGTLAWTACALNRRGVGVDLGYHELAKRNRFTDQPSSSNGDEAQGRLF